MDSKNWNNVTVGTYLEMVMKKILGKTLNIRVTPTQKKPRFVKPLKIYIEKQPK